MRLLVVGTGYVGLVTGVCFAEMGHHVTCLDIDQEKITRLKQGSIPIFEPGLEEMVRRNLIAGRLEFSTDYATSVASCLVCFLALSTPSAPDGSANLHAIEMASKTLATHMDGYRLIVNKSTAPIGTAHQIRAWMEQIFQQRAINPSFDVVSNPEFLKEGDAVNDCLKPDRIVIGVDSAHAQTIMRELYAPFMLNHERILFMDVLSAEMTKYAANAMLATRISFMNEIANFCEQVGADVSQVRKGIGRDKRIGHDFLYAGMGYGGSCFPKDIQALKYMLKKANCSSEIICAVDTVNERQKKVLGHKIIDYFSLRGGLQDKVIAIWGLSFKPGTDDMREAVSLVLIQQLLEHGAILRVYDPAAMDNARQILKGHKNIIFCSSEKQAAENVDAIALVTEWKQFRFVEFEEILRQMRGCAFFDGRNQYNPEEMSERGFDYISVGRPQQQAGFNINVFTSDVNSSVKAGRKE